VKKIAPKTVLFTSLLIALAAPTWAQGIYTAADCSQSAVQAAITKEIAAAADGDIISIPAGTCTWTASSGITASFTKSVTIQGAGAVSATTGGASTTGSDQTIIVDNISTNGHNALNLTIATGKLLQVTGIALLQNGSSVATNGGVLAITGSANSVRIHHNHFYTNSGNTSLRFFGAVTGVTDHNYFDACQCLTTTVFFSNADKWGGYSYGDGSWSDADNWGTDKFMFLEDNRFMNGSVSDGYEGGRYVVRKNTMNGSPTGTYWFGSGQMFNHGLDNGRPMGNRAAEIYQNTWSYPSYYGTATYSLNSGTLLYWGNSVTRFYYGVTMDYTRKNNATYNFGSPPTGWGNCDAGAGTYTVWDAAANGVCMQQGGRGRGALVTGGDAISSVTNSTTQTQFSPSQDLSPIYIWANTFTSVQTPITNQYSGYQQNRDYYTDYGGSTGVRSGLRSGRPTTCTAGPGGNTPGVGYWATDENTLYVCSATNTWSAYYTPYTYPHPLTGATTTTLAPPTNLAATVR
jgi:hypothetical protein